MPANDPEIYFAEDGAPRSGRFGDIYYSLQDGLDETRSVFLTGCHLPEAWDGRDHFTVLELGFGTGLNVAALMQLWTKRNPSGFQPGVARLHIFSIEGFLMDAESADRALSAWPELALFKNALLAQWPHERRGFHHMDFPQWGISLTLALMDVRAALAAWQGPADAVFLDGFSPALNPDMWAEDVLAAIARVCSAKARLATFTVAGFVRRSLKAVGFEVEKCPGFGKKRERLEAVLSLEIAPDAKKAGTKKIAVIGAGIGGCSLAYQARLMGFEIDLFDAFGTGSGASGNEAALVTPRLDAGDNEISALFADAFTYARELYRRLSPPAVLGMGVFQSEATVKDASRFSRIREQTCFAKDDLSLFCEGEAFDMPDAKGIALNTALWIKPAPVLTALLGATVPKPIGITAVTELAGLYTLTSVEGELFSGYDAVILACGDGIFDFADYRHRYDLRPVRGQVEIAATDTPLQTGLSWGGYAIPLGDHFIFGATHEREDRGTEVREADRIRNLESLAKAMPERARDIDREGVSSRASIRVMTRDYLPIMGRASDGLWLLTGLGARGFCLAPLLAKALLSELAGVASPLTASTRRWLCPERLSQHP